LEECRIELEVRPAETPGYAAVLVLGGAHDMATADQIGDTLAAVDGNVLVDFSDCEFIDSSVINVLLERAANVKRDGHRLELVVPPANETITRVLKIVRADAVLVVHPERPVAAKREPL
jgi:anti-anti-sigma factor